METGIDRESSRRIQKLESAYSDGLFYVTLACNLRCPRCFLHDLKTERRRYMMSWEQYERILTRLTEQHVHLRLMHFTGGEPTLWPHLVRAISLAKSIGIADTIRVVTNGVDRCAQDYGAADIVHVSHYGAVNRLDILRLRSQMGRRLKIQYTVHLPWPFDKPSANNMPSDCGCINLAFLGDRVYPCGLSAARDAPGFLGIEDNFYYQFVNGDPNRQELCRTCISNRKNKIDHMTGLTMEGGIWDSPLSILWTMKTKGLRLRRLYRFVRRLRGLK